MITHFKNLMSPQALQKRNFFSKSTESLESSLKINRCYFFLNLLLLSALFCSCTATISELPLTQRSTLIQSGQKYVLAYQDDEFNVTFQYLKSTPLAINTYFALSSLYIDIQDSLFYLYQYAFQLGIQNSYETLITFNIKNIAKKSQINYINIRYIILDPEFPDAKAFTKIQWVQPSISLDADIQTYQSTDLPMSMEPQQKPKIYSFMTMLYMKSSSSSFSMPKITMGINVTATQYNQSHIQLNAALNPQSEVSSATFELSIMVVLPNHLILQINYQWIQYPDIRLDQTNTYYTLFDNKITKDETYGIFGLQSISFQLLSSSSYTLVYYNIYTYWGGEMSFNINRIKQINLPLFAFNYNVLSCSNPLYPFGRIEQDIFRCYKQCQPRQYIRLQLAFSEKSYFCFPCRKECKTCQDQQVCTTCWEGYQPSVQSNDPLLVTCELLQTYFQQLDNGTAKKCQEGMEGCERCSFDFNGSVFECNKCLQGFYMEQVNMSCISCNAGQVENCLVCDNQTMCLECETGYELIDVQRCQVKGTVNRSNGNTDEIISKSCADPINCMTCSQSNTAQCLACFDLNRTLSVSGKCEIVCGDGKIFPQVQECDDNNVYSFDGCSSECKLESPQKYECENSAYTSNQGYFFVKTSCQYSGQISLSLDSISKVTSKNLLIVKFSLSDPFINLWIDYWTKNLSELFSMHFPIPTANSNELIVKKFFYFDSEIPAQVLTQSQRRKLQTSISESNLNSSGFMTEHYMWENFKSVYLSISYQLTQQAQDSLALLSQLQLQQTSQQLNFEDYPLQIVFNPSLSTSAEFKFVRSAEPSQKLRISLQSSNNQLVHYYTAEYYEMYEPIKMMGYCASLLCLAMFALSLVISGFQKGSLTTLMALEYAAITQLTYYSLGMVGALNTLFVGLAEGLKPGAGLNVSLTPESEGASKVNPNLAGIGYTSFHFADNTTVQLGLILVCLVVGGILKLISHQMSQTSALTNADCFQDVPIQNSDLRQRSITQPIVNPQAGPQQTKIEAQKTKSVKQEEIQRKQSKVDESNKDCKANLKAKINSASNFIFANIGLPLFMFFSYSIFTSLAVQLQFYDQVQIMDGILMALMALVCLGYMLIITQKFEIVSNLVQKNFIMKLQNSQQESEQQPQTSLLNIRCTILARQLIPKAYLIIMVLQRAINGMMLVFLSSQSLQAILPIVLYVVIFILFITKLDTMQQAQKIRFSIILGIGICVQMMLACRKFLMIETNQNDEANIPYPNQSLLSQYVPLSIAGALILAGIVSLVYYIYAIKKFRCCQLDLKRERLKVPYKRANRNGENEVQGNEQQQREDQNQELPHASSTLRENMLHPQNNDNIVADQNANSQQLQSQSPFNTKSYPHHHSLISLPGCHARKVTENANQSLSRHSPDQKDSINGFPPLYISASKKKQQKQEKLANMSHQQIQKEIHSQVTNLKLHSGQTGNLGPNHNHQYYQRSGPNKYYKANKGETH